MILCRVGALLLLHLKLSDKEVRKQAGINGINMYLFLRTWNSEIHASGWHALHNICDDLVLKDPVNMKSTSNRESCQYSVCCYGLVKDRDSHIGHSETVNKQIK